MKIDGNDLFVLDVIVKRIYAVILGNNPWARSVVVRLATAGGRAKRLPEAAMTRPGPPNENLPTVSIHQVL